MKSFEYAAPSKLKDALELLGNRWGETEILAGGTDLVTSLKQNISSPKRVVSLKNIPDLRGIKTDRNTIRIGATTTLAELAANKDVQKHFPALVTAVRGIGSPQIISTGTVGGDLCQRPRCWYFRNGLGLLSRNGEKALPENGANRYHAIFGNENGAHFVSASSLGPALIALDATLTISAPGGKQRKVAAREFFQTPKTEGERETVLKPNEILAQIEVPMRGLKNATYEVRHRHGLDWPYVTASVAYDPKGGSPRVVLGHVAPVPWVVPGAEKKSSGGAVDDQSIQAMAEAAVAGAKPLSQNGYKVQMVKTAVKRALMAAGKA